LTWADIAPERVEFKTHQRLIVAFGVYLVKPGLLSADIDRLLQNTQFLRQAAHYDAMPVSQVQPAQALVRQKNLSRRRRP
jgi:uncharacterized protein (UPF0332 family)